MYKRQLTDSLIYNTYANAGNGTTMGTEFIFRNKIKSWWDLTCNLNLFYVNLQAGTLPDTRNIDRFSWFSKLNSTFYLPANFGFQLSADYQAKTLPVSYTHLYLDFARAGADYFVNNRTTFWLTCC